MPEFTYVAMARTGQRSQGNLTANSEREAMSQLDARGLFPVSIAPVKAARQSFSFGGSKIKSRYMSAFYAQLADLLQSGVPLLRSMDILQRQTFQPALSQIIRDIRARVADGSGLAEAMAHHPNAFNELAVSMVRAGQEGGFLEDVLHRIATFTEHQEELKSKVAGALAYPIFLAIAGFVILNILIIFFVPKFDEMFKKLAAKGELPWITSVIIGLSKFIQGNWYWIVFGIVAMIVGFTSWSRSESGRVTLDGWRLHIPGAGKIYLQLAIGRFTRILGTLLSHGIPILQALRIAKDSTGNRVLSAAIERSAENLKAGDSLARPLAASKLFPPDVVEIVAVGEESNNLEKVLLNIAEGLERRTSRQLDLFVRLLEPVMLLFMAGAVLTVVVALLLPIFKLSSAIG
jgi:general secretion pathway protein F/type IV pilus assembly protein PilC